MVKARGKLSRRVVTQINRMGKRRHPRRDTRIPLAMAAGFVPLIMDIYNDAKGKTSWGDKLKSVAYEGMQGLTGFEVPAIWGQSGDPKWYFSNLQFGLMPILFGVMAHKVIGQKLGVNRWLKRMRIPYVEI